MQLLWARECCLEREKCARTAKGRQPATSSSRRPLVRAHCRAGNPQETGVEPACDWSAFTAELSTGARRAAGDFRKASSCRCPRVGRVRPVKRGFAARTAPSRSTPRLFPRPAAGGDRGAPRDARRHGQDDHRPRQAARPDQRPLAGRPRMSGAGRAPTRTDRHRGDRRGDDRGSHRMQSFDRRGCSPKPRCTKRRPRRRVTVESPGGKRWPPAAPGLCPPPARDRTQRRDYATAGPARTGIPAAERHIIPQLSHVEQINCYVASDMASQPNSLSENVRRLCRRGDWRTEQRWRRHSAASAAGSSCRA